MLAIPPDLLACYDAALAQDGIPEYQRAHYRRWLRFYLDFCAKYERAPLERETVRSFLRKLLEKGQADWMRKQAVDAVRLYFFLGETGAQHPPGTRNSAGALQASRARRPAAQPSAQQSAQSAVRPAARSAVEPAPAAAPESTPRRADGGAGYGGRTAASGPTDPHEVATRGAGHVGTSRPTQAPGGGEAQRPGPPIGARPAAAQATTAPTGGAAPNGWPELYDQLTAAIQVRHYSAKTLKSYRSWARQLQGFTRNKPPAALAVDDVKTFLTHLAVDKQVSASSQNQAFNALLFVHDTALQKALKTAVQGAGIPKRASAHTLRHYSARRIMSNGRFGLALNPL
ncbi:site-specific integrase [uncultured Thiohalocapsa sp.]|uniref:site-specific integrase n=1 Tax=uncultured Thiohalocapsa sp. TaxID=768990 RepID=UPI0025E33349|nr:site-specific integrase [uncultured Thiohalocapsa sp.]